MKCCRCGAVAERGSTLEVAGELRARIRLCPCCSEALLDWLRLGDGGVLPFRRWRRERLPE
jgi:hypothetical protein